MAFSFLLNAGMEMFREKAEEGTTAHFMRMHKSPVKSSVPKTQVWLQFWDSLDD
jgi:hypothetical protein